MAEDNQVLPAATGAAGGMDTQIHHFLKLLMGGGLHGFGGFGGQPFGGFGHFLMSNPALMRGLGLMPHDQTAPAGGGPAGAAPSVNPNDWTVTGSPSGAPAPAAPPAAGGGGAPTSPITMGWNESPFRPGGPLLGLPKGGGAELPPIAGGPTGVGNPGDPMWGGMTVHGAPSSGAPSTLPPMLRKG